MSLQHLIFTIILSTFLALDVNAQRFDIEPESYTDDDNVYQSLRISLKAKKGDAKAAWNDFIKDKYDVDVNGYSFLRKKDHLKTEELPMAFMSNKRIVLNAHFKKVSEFTAINLFITDKNEQLIRDLDEEVISEKLEKLAEEYVIHFLPEYYEDRVNALSKKYDEHLEEIKDRKDDISNFKDDISNFKEEISKLQTKISETEGEITDLELEQKLKKKKLDDSYKTLTIVRKKTDALNKDN